MRTKTYSIFYLAIMAIYIIRPVMPYIEYAVNKDYIAKYLCVQKDIPDNSCHGLWYLHEQLIKNSEPIDANSDDNRKNTDHKKIEDHLKSEEITASHFVKEFSFRCFYFAVIIDFYISFVFVPPNSFSFYH
jgi:hypothetical protein